MREARLGAGRAATGALITGLVLLFGTAAAGAEGTIPEDEATVAQAQQTAQQTDPAVLAPSLSASLEGQSVQPAITDSGEELSSTGTLTSSTISKENPGEFAVNTSAGELSLKPIGLSPSASTPTIVNDAAALFANTAPATDNIIRPDALGASAILQLRSTVAPTSFSWEVGLGPGQRLQQLPGGSVAVVRVPLDSAWEGPLPNSALEAPEASNEASAEPESESESSNESENEGATEEPSPEPEEAPLASPPAVPQTSTPAAQAIPGEIQPQETPTDYTAALGTVQAAQSQTGGTAEMVISPPVVADAHGNSVPASLSALGNTLTLTLTPSSSTAFPVMAATTVAAPSDQASAAASRPLYGFADQRPTTFSASFDPRLIGPPLNIGTARLVIAYDAAYKPTEELEAKEKKEGKRSLTEGERLTAFLHGVGEMKNSAGEPIQAYVTFWSRNCIEGKACSAPPLTRYRKAVRAMITRYMSGNATAGLPPVTLWGAWNEPDLDPARLHSAKAAELWKVAQSVITHHCGGCTMVAGEFAEYNKVYIEHYKRFMVTHHFRPPVWGLHDYQDLIAVPAPEKPEEALKASYVNSAIKGYAKLTSTRLGKPRIWLSEQGVELENQTGATRLKGNPELQRVSAEDFLRLASTSRRIELVNYYMYHSPEPSTEHPHPEEEKVFDSGLLNEKGEPRPAYCVLAYVSHQCPTLPPTVITGKSFDSVGNSPVTLDGEVNPNGGATTYYFEYGLTIAYGHTTTSESAGAGTTNIHVTAKIASEEQCAVGGTTETHFRLIATNAAGTVEGNDSKVTYLCPE
jgi:hypothetical protein